MSYHASGIKVNDIASEVGLGWALNAGGMISRSINGQRDEKSYVRTFFNSGHLLDSLTAVASHYGIGCSCLDSIMYFEDFFTEDWENEDPMNDRYFYKLPNGPSGVFTYNYNDVYEDSAITLPYRPLKIRKYLDWSMSYPRIGRFEMTDDNGTIYTFQTYLSNPITDYSEWFLKEMISADGTDTIAFNYTAQAANSSFPTVSHSYQGAVVNPTGYCSPDNLSSVFSGSLTPVPEFNTPVLESIVSSKAVVKFEYDSRNDFNYLKRLTRITIAPVNSPTDTIKRVKLIPKYFGTTDANRRLGLDSVIVDAPGDTHPQVYAFTYESQVLPPYPIKMTYPTYAYPTYSEDYWGYYNGSNSLSLVPVDFITATYDKGYYGGNREADDGDYSKACMLKEIKYPTGGRTVFEFERHYASSLYPYKSAGGYVGGFRVASITNYTGGNEAANVKTYEYAFPTVKQLNYGHFDYDQYFVQKKYIPASGGSPETWCWSSYSRDVLSSNPLLPFEVAPGIPVTYSEVVEYNGTLTNNTGKTVYGYYPPYSPSDYFNNPEHPLEFEAPQFYHPYHYDKGNFVPELGSKTVYSFDGTNYHPLTHEQYEYTKLYTREFNTGIKLSRPKQFADPTYFAFICPYPPPICSYQGVIDEYLSSVVALDTKAYQEASLLTNSKNYVFDPLDSTEYVLTSTDYIYNENNLAVQKKSTLSSKGDTLKTFYKYPIDYAGTAVYDSMVARNIISPVVEQSNYSNSAFLQSSKTNFHAWSSTLIAPQTVDYKTLENDAETRLRFHAYDSKGNTVTVSKENDQKLSYIWDYNNAYPIAQVTNAEASGIAYTSFEADGKGGWTFSGAVSADGTAPTGGNCYNVSGGNISRSGLTSATYIVSYWGKTGSVNVNSAGPTRTGKTIGNWTYYEHELSTTSITVSGNKYIDELRLYPAGALMTTQTYMPLAGISTQCDANNRITYYSYDDFGRLTLVRDPDGHIIRKICYNYAGQVEDCGVFASANYSGNYYSQNCGSQNPLPYNVSVPAGMFSSTVSLQDANTQAQQYAQQQANLYGTCEADVAITYINNGPGCYTVEFYNPSTGFDVWFEIPSGSGTLGYVPPGTYHILITSSCDGVTRTFYAVCHNSSTADGYGIFLDRVVNAMCHNIEIH